MSQGRPRLFSATECAELWRRYKAGESILGIGRALCGGRSGVRRGSSAVRRVLECTGGIAPPERRRSSRVLSLVEREEVSRGIAVGDTIRAIARGLNRAVSTVSQEVSRHGGRDLYRAAEADLAAWDSALRPKPCLLAKNRELQRIVAVKLKHDWAPQQIAGWLKDEYPGNPELWVSHETIYRSLFVQARGALKKELIGHLRSKRRIRRSRHATYCGEGRGQIIDAVSIRQRPAEAEIGRSQVTGKGTW
jgi:IS30 family transposase